MGIYNKILRILRAIGLVLIDILIVFFSYAVSLYLRFDDVKTFAASEYVSLLIKSLPLILVVYVVVYTVMNFYRTIWHYAGMTEIAKITFASFISTIIVFGILFCYSSYNGTLSMQLAVLPESVYFTAPFFISGFIILERFVIRAIHKTTDKDNKDKHFELSGRIMIVGAGDAAALLLENMSISDMYKGAKPICLIDDNPQKQGMYVHNCPVVGTRKDIIRVALDKKIDVIIFCIPSCPAEERAKILKICQKTNCKLKTLPAIYQLTSAKDISTKSVRNVEIEDLLGREPIKLELDCVEGYVGGKTVLVTGGGGSIGSELSRQIAANNPKKLVIFDIYENNAYDIQNELKRTYPELDLEVLIGSVRDSRRINHVFKKFRPEIVYHAAAHKHVPLMEDSPNEAIKNNVFGTLKTVRAADKYGAERFVLISTDKAVNPTNIMGASKRMCEMIVQSYNKISKTNYVAVRFGNVLGSNGSVVPLFKRQIENGGPVTVTDPSIIRYFMTIPEAVSLVLQAGAYAKGGEIFVLDMGEPVKIIDLAENLIRLSGFTPYVDMDIKFTGLRPGEKKYEELLMSEEGLQQTDNKLIFIGRPIEFDENEFIQSLDSYKENIYDDDNGIRDWVKKFVPTYHKPE